MSVIFLNTWHSTLCDELRTYIQRHVASTDVFCFQEAYTDDRGAYEDVLAADFTVYEATKINAANKTWYGNVIYVRNHIEVSNIGTLFQDEEPSLLTGLALYIDLTYAGKTVTICNVHGVPYPGHKLDTPARLVQTERIINTFKDMPNVIIGGDFNLLPDVKSIRLFSDYGYRNLIHDFAVPTTRNQITFDAYPDNIQYFADYLFVSPGVDVRQFTVPSDIVSDHQPLMLEWTIPHPMPEPSSYVTAGGLVTA